MKHVTVYFDKEGFDSYPFNKEEYRTAYYELADLIRQRRGTFHIARGYSTFLGENTFSKGWAFNGTEFVEHGPMTFDLIYDKGYRFFKSDIHSNVLNDRELDLICTDKSKTIEVFPDLSPKTFTVHDAQGLEKVLATLDDERVVAKPLDGEEGKGVVIGSVEEIRTAVHSYPYLIQQFIDTSGGIPGIVEGIHDFRIISVAGEPVVAYVRTPPPGKLAANVALGGREIPVPLAQIPEGALKVFHEVDAKFTKYPNRVYGVDMGLHSDGSWKIIELNSKPGLTPLRMGPDYVRYLNLLADTLLG